MTEPEGILERTVAALTLEEVGGDRFSVHPGGEGGRLFGGLVAAQCVLAAGRTVAEERKLHSLHLYFLRPGAAGVPIELVVERIRDGGSYSTRSVRALQRGAPILSAMSSFARDESGLSQQSISMPEAPEPFDLLDREQERSRRDRARLGVDRPPYQSAVEVRLCDPDVVEPELAKEPRQDNWLRVRGDLGQNQLLQRAMLVYASDRVLLSTARLPFDLARQQLMSVSLDHVVWIHRDVDMTDWHLCQCSSPVSEGGRSVLLSHLYRQDGVCVATVAQEGLLRVRRSSLP